MSVAAVQYSDDGQWWWDGAAWRSVQSDPPPAASAPASTAVDGAINPAVIAVARPQYFLAASEKGKYQAPMDGPAVDHHSVAILAVCLPLVAMWDEGVIDITHSVSKKLMMTFNSVKAAVLQDVARPGMGGQLLAQLKRHPDVDSAVRNWIGSDRANPWNHVIGTAVNEGVDLGVYHKVDANRNFVAAAFKGNFTLQVDGDRVRAADPEANRLAAAFKRHRETQAEVHQQLWKKVEGAIKSRTESNDRNDDF